MKQSLMLMEELQAIYAAHYRVSIWVTDKNGEMMLEPKGRYSSDLFRKLYTHKVP